MEELSYKIIIVFVILRVRMFYWKSSDSDGCWICRLLFVIKKSKFIFNMYVVKKLVLIFIFLFFFNFIFK